MFRDRPDGRALFIEQWKAASVIAWLVLTAISIPVLIAPVLLPDETILRFTPICERKRKYGTECALCGMTRSFIDIAHGRFREASEKNSGGIPLYFGLLSNQIAAVAFVAGGKLFIKTGGRTHGVFGPPAP